MVNTDQQPSSQRIMKPLPTKAQIRAQLAQEIQQYLQGGGVVHDIPKGASGRTDNHNPFGQMGSNPPPQPRTPVTEVIKTLEARKHPPTPRKTKRPYKKLITDDFGEPLRWIWVED